MTRLGLSLALLALTACGPSRDKATEAGHPEERSGRQASGATPEEGVVRVAEDMLRDLKLTTARVEARAGGEGSAVLGELHVDETRYAELSSPVAAEVLRLLAGPGDAVRPGQALIELASHDVGQARGAYRETEARRDLALQALTRKRRLAEERIAPLREVQEAEAEYRAAEAAVAAARATLDSLRVSADGPSGGRFTLAAPLAGVVIERSVVQGQVVEPGRALFRLGDLTRLWLVAHASERDAVRVRVGSIARVSVPALPNEAFEARVAHVGEQVEVASRTIPVRLTLVNRGGRLRPGMSATVSLPIGEGATLLSVPAAALQRLHDAWCVFIPRDEGLFEVRPVGRGRELGGEVEILSGLTAGETIVVEGAFLLKAEGEKAESAGGHHDH